MRDLIGTSLGRYQVKELLGEGGMATVYKAVDSRLERLVAIKLIRGSAFSAEIFERVLKRFNREAKTMANLTHPNIVSVMDYGEYEGAPFLVMEYMAGGTLRQRMGQPIPYAQAAQLLKPVAEALAYAHEEGVVHRDIKPANILLTAKGQPMLSDFGIARLLENEDGTTLTGAGMGIGTPEYMAPEQGIGGDVDGRADIYSLGVVFYELLTGQKPFTARTPMGVIVAQINQSLPDPRQYVPGLPVRVIQVLQRALAKKPEDRFESMAEFAAALSALSGPIPASAMPEVPRGVPAAQVQPEENRADEELTNEPTADLGVHVLSPRPAFIPPPPISENVPTEPAATNPEPATQPSELSPTPIANSEDDWTNELTADLGLPAPARRASPIIPVLAAEGASLRRIPGSLNPAIPPPVREMPSKSAPSLEISEPGIKDSNLMPWLSILGIALGWAITGAIVWSFSGEFGWQSGWFFYMLIGGAFTGAVILHLKPPFSWLSWFGITLSYAIGGVIWAFGWAISWAIGGLGMSLILHQNKRIRWRDVVIITVGWTFGWVVGWAIGWKTGVVLVGAIAGAIGGAVTIWRLRSDARQTDNRNQ